MPVLSLMIPTRLCPPLVIVSRRSGLVGAAANGAGGFFTGEVAVRPGPGAELFVDAAAGARVVAGEGAVRQRRRVVVVDAAAVVGGGVAAERAARQRQRAGVRDAAAIS